MGDEDDDGYPTPVADQVVEQALEREGIAHLLAPIFSYEQANRLSAHVFCNLGGFLSDTVVFANDALRYCDRLATLDGALPEAKRLLGGAAGRDFVHALCDAVHAVQSHKKGHDGEGRGREEYGVEGLKEILGQETSSVRRREVHAYVTRCRAAGITLPGLELLRPGHKVLSAAKDALQPKQSADATALRSPPTWPVLDLEKVDNESGRPMCPAGANSAACVHAYHAHLLACLMIGYNMVVPPSHMATRPGEGAYVPTGGHKMLNEESVMTHMGPIQAAQLATPPIEAAAMRHALTELNKKVREHIVGTGDAYAILLCPGAALRAAASDAASLLKEAQHTTTPPGPRAGETGAGAPKREREQAREGETPERRAQREARRQEHERRFQINEAARRSGTMPARGGYAARPAFAPQAPPCRDFANTGQCRFGRACKFSHALGAPPPAPPPGYMQGYAPPAWGPMPPPGPPPPQLHAPGGAPHFPALMGPPKKG